MICLIVCTYALKKKRRPEDVSERDGEGAPGDLLVQAEVDRVHVDQLDLLDAAQVNLITGTKSSFLAPCSKSVKKIHAKSFHHPPEALFDLGKVLYFAFFSPCTFLILQECPESETLNNICPSRFSEVQCPGLYFLQNANLCIKSV